MGDGDGDGDEAEAGLSTQTLFNLYSTLFYSTSTVHSRPLLH